MHVQLHLQLVAAEEDGKMAERELMEKVDLTISHSVEERVGEIASKRLFEALVAQQSK